MVVDASQNSQLAELLLAGAPKWPALKKQLITLQQQNELEVLLTEVLALCRQGRAFVLPEGAFNFFSRHFASITSVRAKTILGQFVGFGPDAAGATVPLIGLLVENVQLLNAHRFRDSVKLDVVRLHNDLREHNKDELADRLLLPLVSVLLFEMALLDGMSPEKIENVWLEIREPKQSRSVYLFMSYVFYSSLGKSDLAKSMEDDFCRSSTSFSSQLIEYMEPFIHVPVFAFSDSHVKSFLGLLLDHYFASKDLSCPLITLLLANPEVRSTHLVAVDKRLMLGLVSCILRHVPEVLPPTAKWSQDAHKDLLKQVDALWTTDITPELLGNLFSSVVDFFAPLSNANLRKFLFLTKAVLDIAEVVPGMSADAHAILTAGIMPAVVMMTTQETLESLVPVLHSMTLLVTKLPVEYVSELSEHRDSVHSFLAVAVRKLASKPSCHDSVARLLTAFLRDDWSFIKALPKLVISESNTPLQKLFLNALATTDAVKSLQLGYSLVCFKALLGVYEAEAAGIKEGEFKPRKGLTFLARSLEPILRKASPADLASQKDQQLVLVTLGLFTVGLRLVRLCHLAGCDAEITAGLREVAASFVDGYFEFDLFAKAITDPGGVDGSAEALVEGLLVGGRYIDRAELLSSSRGLVTLASNLEDSLPIMERISISLDTKTCLEALIQVLLDYPPSTLAALDQALKSEIKEDPEEYKPAKKKRKSGGKKFHQPKAAGKVEAVCTIVDVLVRRLQSLEEAVLETVAPSVLKYAFSVFLDFGCQSPRALGLATTCLKITKNTSVSTGDLVNPVVMSLTAMLADQRLQKRADVLLTELKKSIAVAQFVRAALEPFVLQHQLPTFGYLLSSLIASLSTYRRFITEFQEGTHTATMAYVREARERCDRFAVILASITKHLAAQKSSIRQLLPFIASNCLTGEREPSLPMHHLLTGASKQGVSFLSNALPNVEKQRLTVMFPSFISSTADRDRDRL